MSDSRKVCHVVLAVDIKSQAEQSRKQWAARVRKNTLDAQDQLTRWLKERDPKASVVAPSSISIAPTVRISATERVVKELLNKLSRPPMVETIVVIDSQSKPGVTAPPKKNGANSARRRRTNPWDRG